MKKLIILLLAVLVLSTAVSAVLDVPSELSLGSDTQRRSNPLADDEDYYVINVDETFSISSDTAVTDVDVVLTGDIRQDKYNATLEVVTTGVTSSDIANGIRLDLEADTLVSIKLKVTVPSDLDGIDSDFVEASMLIGGVLVTAGIETATSEVKLQAENFLKLEKVRASINEGTWESIDDDEKIEDVKPGDVIRLEVKTENKYQDNSREDLDIESVLIDVTNIDPELDDFDDDDDVGDIVSEDEETVIFEFEVDSDTDKGTYDFTVTVDGLDQNGAKHGERWTLSVEVDREKHDIIIEEMLLEPTQVECGDIGALSIGIKNLGRNDEDDVAVSIRSLGLNGLFEKSDYDNLNQDDDDTIRFDLDIDEDQEAGTYRIDVQTYYDKTKTSQKDSVILNVVCTPEVTPGPTEDVEYIQPGLSVKSTLTVPVTFNVAGSSHTVSVNSFDTASSSAVVVVRSTPVTLSLQKGVPQRVDLGVDNKDDLVVTLLGVSLEGVVDLQLQELTRGIQQPTFVVTSSYQEQSGPPVINEPESEVSGLFEGAGYIIALIIIDVLILIVAVVLISKAMSKK